jgi:PAS domain S-box-containing protein
MDDVPRELLATILHSVADGIIVRDLSGRLLYANDTAARMTGYASAQEYVAASPAEVFERFEILDEDGSLLPLERLPGQEAMAGRGPSERIVRFRVKETGEERWSLVAASLIADDAGHDQYVVSSFRDVTTAVQRRRDAETDAVRQAFLAEVSHQLASSLDYEATLAAIARLAVPRIADWCSVDVLDEDGHIRRLAVAHVNPDKVAYAHELGRRFPVEQYPPKVLETGEPELISDITDEVLVALSPTEEILTLLRELGLRSAMNVPLVARGRTLGVISFVAAESGRRYNEEDLAFAQELAAQAALSVDNARLYRDLDQRVGERTRELETQLAVTREQARLLDLAPDGIFVRDFATRSIIFWSHGAEQLYGWSKPEAHGRNPHELLQTRFPTSLEAVMDDLLRLGRWEGQLVHNRKDGTPLPVASRWVLQRDEAGNPTSFLEINTDLRPHLRAEEERAAREAAEAVAARTALLAESSRVVAEAGLEVQPTLDAIAAWIAQAIGDACIIRMLSDDGQLLEPVAVAHPDPEQRRLLTELVHRTPHHVDDEPIGTVIRTGESLRIPVADDARLRAVMAPEHHAYLDTFGLHSLLYAPLRTHNKTFGAIVIVRMRSGPAYTAEDEALLQSVADRAALAIDNGRLYQQAMQALQLRNEFLAVAAHELKTPLTGLQLSAELLLRRQQTTAEATPGNQSELLHRIYEQSARLARLVNELLDVSRIESGRLELNRQPTDLAELLRAAAETTRQVLRGPTVTVHAPPALPAVVDALRMEQVLSNLLENAVKFSPAGITVEATMAVEKTDTALISVRDHGPGIAEEHRTHIFERFYQVAPSRSTAGLGLGLYISRQIVELHGGELWAEFPPDGGTCFFVRLPTGARPYASSAPYERSTTSS